MSIQSELIVSKELDTLQNYAQSKGFEIIVLNSLAFVAKNLPAANGYHLSVYVECDDYPIKPPIFQWCDPLTYEKECPKDTPIGDGGYFHNSGTPCAPWNRNSYKQYRSAAPHGDWDMSGWQNNPKTGQCINIPRMIVKICTEIQSIRFKGKKE